jgi:hypothetical protein
MTFPSYWSPSGSGAWRSFDVVRLLHEDALFAAGGPASEVAERHERR